jgi:DNA mismatch repair ATPase MutS
MKSSFFTSDHTISTNRRLRQGLSLSSYGLNCAAFSGIPQEIISRAELYTQLQSSGEDLVGMIRGESDEKEMRDLKIAEAIAQRFVAWDIALPGDGRLRSDLVRILG